MTSVQKNKFKIILRNSKTQLDVDYILHDSTLAVKWFQKIKHLSKIPHDPIESETVDVSDLVGIYKEFCQFAELEPIEIGDIDQQVLNTLHKIYEGHHGKLSKKRGNDILYKFHHSIHHNEDKPNSKKNSIMVGWGTKEGPLTQQFLCHQFYADSIERNQIYLPWAELGKKPFVYWKNKEPNDQQRFNQLSKPHLTFRPKFFIALHDSTPQAFDTDFVKWFSKYKKQWCDAHGINDYEEKHQYSAPVLAHTDYSDSLDGFKFEKVVL